MTYTRSYTIWCDGDCGEWAKFEVRSATYATTRAREEGWTSPEWGEHYCPRCAESRRSVDTDTENGGESDGE